MDQFKQCERNVKKEKAALEEAYGISWVWEDGNPRAHLRPGLTPAQYNKIRAKVHRDNGCPPGCPARRRA